MTVNEFCKKYQISQQAVYAKIKRKSAQLDGHVTKSGGQLVIDEYAEECLKPKCADFTLVRKIQKLQNQLDDKNAECENLKKLLEDEISKNANLQNCLDDKNSEIENLTNQLAEKNLKIADYEKSAAAQSEENFKLSETVRLLTDEILNRDRKIEELQNKNAELEAAAKKPFGFPSKRG